MNERLETAGMKAMRLYLNTLRQEYERINGAMRGPRHEQQSGAQEKIKLEMLGIEKDMELLAFAQDNL